MLEILILGPKRLVQWLPRLEHDSENVCQRVKWIKPLLADGEVLQQTVFEIAQDKVWCLTKPLIIGLFKGKSLAAGLMAGVSVRKGSQYSGDVAIISPDAEPRGSTDVIGS